MTADELRQASGEMRRLAEAATPGPWKRVPNEAPTTYVYPEGRVLSTAPGMDDQDPSIADTLMHCDASHIAAWHPDVALAVATLLSMMSDHAKGRGSVCNSCVEQTLAVARAFLGTTP